MKRLKILLCLALASLAYGADLNTASKKRANESWAKQEPSIKRHKV